MVWAKEQIDKVEYELLNNSEKYSIDNGWWLCPRIIVDEERYKHISNDDNIYLGYFGGLEGVVLFLLGQSYYGYNYDTKTVENIGWRNSIRLYFVIKKFKKISCTVG